MRHVKPPRADCFEVANAYFTARPLLLQGQMFPARIVELGEGSPQQHLEQQLQRQAQAQQAARVMRCVKPPRADCLEAASAYFTAWGCVASGQMLPARIVELGEGGPRRRPKQQLL